MLKLCVHRRNAASDCNTHKHGRTSQAGQNKLAVTVFITKPWMRCRVGYGLVPNQSKSCSFAMIDIPGFGGTELLRCGSAGSACHAGSA